MAILIGLFLFGRPVFPEDATNKTPPPAQFLSAGGETSLVSTKSGPGRAGASEVAGGSDVCRRDPFWPIGFFPTSMPGRAFGPADSVDSARDKKTAFQAAGLSGMLRIGGVIKRGNQFYVTINGFTVQTGEVISVVAEGEAYKFVIEGIDFNKVQFRPLGR